ncbi:MAG TPA: sigma-70 family RNA polymerase sigma factor [Gemmataceae bacterium]|nr:sigma-70 family RNA polymerase sigma factor [Gemmataceae bacterium]
MKTPAISDYFRAAAVGGDASDAALLERFAAARDESAFELLVWRHAALVQRVCRGVLHDHHAAEDAAQASFLVLARKAGTVRGSVVGWLYRVARRVSVRLAKQRSRSPVIAELDHVPVASIDSAAPDELAAVCDAVAALPERYRVPVLLCFFEGLTHAEAARRIGWPVGTVAGRLARAKDMLARRLSRKGVGVAAVALGVPAGNFVGATAQAAAPFANHAASPVSPSVLSLAEGACKAMTLTVTKGAALAAGLFLATATVWGVTQTGGGSAPPPPGQPPPAVEGGGNPVKPAVVVPFAAGDRVADAKQRARSLNNLKQIVLAMHNYEAAYGHFPADITDKDGKPLLSWRVELLPFLEQGPLYQKIKRDEPWDSETNKKVLAQMPDIYRVGFEPKGETKTYYQGYSGKGAAFEPGEKLKLFSTTDGTSNTLAAVEAGPPVEWTKPGGIPFDEKKPLAPRDGPFKNVFAVCAMDGAAYLLKPDIDEATLKIAIGRNDGQVNPPLGTLKAKLPLTADEVKTAQEVLKTNEKLIDSIRDQLREQQRLIVALGKLQNPKEQGTNLDLERLGHLQQGLEVALERLKKETEELEKEVKALGKK